MENLWGMEGIRSPDGRYNLLNGAWKMVIKAEDKVTVNTVLLDLDDQDIDGLVAGLLDCNSAVKIIASEPCYKRLETILGSSVKFNAVDIPTYLDIRSGTYPLVNTMHAPIYAGILADRSDAEEVAVMRQSLKDLLFIDAVVSSVGDYKKFTGLETSEFERSRQSIQVSNLSILMAAAKNFPYCAAISGKDQYDGFLSHLSENDGCTKMNYRMELAVKAMVSIASYIKDVADHLDFNAFMNSEEISKSYGIRGEDEKQDFGMGHDIRNLWDNS